MKREFLEGLGLEKDAIDKIMAENGKDIEAGKAKLEEEQRLRQAAEQAVKDRDKQIADLFKVDAAGLQAEVERLKTENAAAFTGRRCTRARDDIALKTCDKGGILKANGKQYKTVILYTGGRKNSGIADGI